MHPAQLQWKEIIESLHPLSPQPGQSQFAQLSLEIDAPMQRIRAVEITLSIGAETRRLRFEDIWLNSLTAADVVLPRPTGAGVLIVDIRAWKWEQPILVVADDEDYMTLFGASTVEKLEVRADSENGI